MESSWPSSDHCSWSSIPNITVSPDEDYRATRDAGERKGELESNRGERERERGERPRSSSRVMMANMSVRSLRSWILILFLN